jgi:apolipoprotein D and lipocalin family protein
MKKILAIILSCVAGLVSCGTPQELSTEGIPAVDDFELKRYLGRWYEIARLDHPFERGLERVTATYSTKEDGGIKVVNRGYDTEDEEWSEAEGKARVPDPDRPAYLEVSFFLWFYSPYKIIKLDEDYQWAVVTSSSKEYLWILSRSPEMVDKTYNRLVDFAKTKGFPLEKLHRVEHSF